MRRLGIAIASMCLAVLLATTLAGVPASGATRVDSVLPAGFQAQSISWVSPMHGWLLGLAPCGGSTCTTVAGTKDGGATWSILGTMDAPIDNLVKTGVTEIRFADDLHGWAFWPAFWSTSDGGVTWTKEAPPGGGQSVPALAGDRDAVYALVSPCRLTLPASECRPATLWRTTAGSDAWTEVDVTLPKLSFARSAVLRVHGVVAYLAVPMESADPDILMATVDGQQWSSRPSPCVKADDEVLTDVAPISDTRVALLCVGDPGFGKATKRVVRSNDTALTTSPAGETPRDGIVSELAAAPNGTLAVSSSSYATFVYRNAGGQTWTTPVIQADGGEGMNDIVFTTNRIGWVVYGPMVDPGRPGLLAETTDGGRTWAPV